MKRRRFLEAGAAVLAALALPAPAAAMDALEMTVSQAAGGKGVMATAPCVTLGPRNHLFVAWEQGGGEAGEAYDPRPSTQATAPWYAQRPGGVDVYYASTPPGDDFAWSKPVLLSDGAGTAWARDGEGPSLRVDRLGYVYASWTRRRERRSDVVLVRSGLDVARPIYRAEDEGRSFVTPVAVNAESGPGVGFQSLAVDENGTIYVAWLDASSGTPSLFVSRSRDGVRFDTVEAGRGFAGAPCAGCRPSLQADGAGRLYLAFRGNDDDERDVYTTWSEDRGQSFATPVRVSPDRWKLRASPDSGPALALGMARQPYVLWWTGDFGVTRESDRAPAGGRILLAGSAGGGRSFSAPLLELRPSAPANRPALAAADNNMVLAWEDLMGGERVVRASYSDDGGRSFRTLRLGAHLPPGMRGVAVGDAARGTLPSVTLDANGDPVVAWRGPEANILAATR